MPTRQSPALGGASRRAFLAAAGVVAAYPANDTINIGCIGTGGRAQMLMRTLERVRGTRIVAVCDVWDENLAKARQLAGANAFATKDHRALLDRKDVDAVLIGAPDHQHVPLTVAACEAGKDVYVEKPLTHDLSEGAAVLEAQNRHKRIVQVGMQQRSMPHLQKAYEIIKSGGIGKVHKVHLTWNRNYARGMGGTYDVDPKTVNWSAFLGKAKNQLFDAYRFRQWRWFWDFGGGILTDLMVHYLDVAHWFLGLDHPAQAMSMGDHFMAKGIWETPDTIQTLLHYPDQQVQIYFEGTFVNQRNAAMMEFMGTEATLYADRGRYEIHPERKGHIGLSPGEVSKMPYSEMVLGEQHRGADFNKNPDGELAHLTDWVQSIRSRKKPSAPVEAGISAASAAHLGNIAYRTGQVAKWKR